MQLQQTLFPLLLFFDTAVIHPTEKVIDPFLLGILPLSQICYDLEHYQFGFYHMPPRAPEIALYLWNLFAYISLRA